MRPFLAAIVAAIALLGAAKVQACESVQLVAPQAVYAAPVQLQQQVVYQPQVLAVEVAHYAQPVVVQQIVVKEKRQRRQRFSFRQSHANVQAVQVCH